MLISHILVQNFGKFENFTCDFSPGINLVKGSNEAGKSTLANAVTAALFLDPIKDKEKIYEARRWNSSSLPCVETVLSADGKLFTLIKDFDKCAVSLKENEQENEIQANSHVTCWISDKLGVPSEEIFAATVCVNQGEISHIDNSVEAIKSKLEALFTGGKEEKTASEAIDKIENKIAQIAGEDGITGGILGKHQRLIEELDYNIEKLHRDIQTRKAKLVDLIQVETAYKNVLEDLKIEKEKLALNQKANKLEADLKKHAEELEKNNAKLNEAQIVLAKIREMRDQQADLKQINKEDVGKAQEFENELNYLQSKRRELEQEVKLAEDDFLKSKIKPVSIILTTIGFLSNAIFAAGYFAGFIFPAYTWYALAPCLAALIFGTVACLTQKQKRSYLKQRFLSLSDKLGNLEKETQRNALSELLSKYSAVCVEELKRKIWHYEELEAQIARKKENYKKILDSGSIEEMEQNQSYLKRQFKSIEEEKNNLANYLADEAEIGRRTLIVKELEERISDLSKERAMLRRHIESAEGGAELLASYLERKEKIKTQIEALLQKISILRLTANCINEARQNVLISTLEVLNNRASEILNKLTSGKYANVRFDKSNLRFEVFSEEKKEWMDPEKSLSKGTVDQIYLAARLALADIISENKNSLMILDDPFINYDEERTENAMKVIKELSENHQILFLTSQDRYDRWADATISL